MAFGTVRQVTFVGPRHGGNYEMYKHGHHRNHARMQRACICYLSMSLTMLNYQQQHHINNYSYLQQEPLFVWASQLRATWGQAHHRASRPPHPPDVRSKPQFYQKTAYSVQYAERAYHVQLPAEVPAVARPRVSPVACILIAPHVVTASDPLPRECGTLLIF